MRTGLLAALTALLLTFAAAPEVSAKSLDEATWIEVVSTNFRIRSVLSKRKTVDLAHHLELMRSVVPSLTNIERTSAAVPTTIYAVRAKDFRTLGIDQDFVGMFMPGTRNNTILIRETVGMEETSIIMHEYVHYLVRTHGGFNYPRWYDEGIAEYFAHSEIRGDNFHIGKGSDAAGYILTNIDWLDGEYFVGSDAYGGALFYSEAWLLVHFLQHAENAPVSLADGLKQYASLVASGIDDVESFETAFGLDADGLYGWLNPYLVKRCCKYLSVPTAEILPDFSPSIRTISRSEAALGLGQLAVRVEKFDLAEAYFTTALSDPRTRPRAMSDSAMVAIANNDFALAEKKLADAVALDALDPYVHLNVANYWIGRANTTEDASLRDDYAEHAKAGVVKAYRLDNSIPEVFVAAGQAYLIQGRDYQRAISMLEEAAAMLPSDLQLRMLLAEAYAKADRRDDAIAHANSVIAWSHQETPLTEEAAGLIASIETHKPVTSPESEQD